MGSRKSASKQNPTPFEREFPPVLLRLALTVSDKVSVAKDW